VHPLRACPDNAPPTLESFVYFRHGVQGGCRIKAPASVAGAVRNKSVGRWKWEGTLLDARASGVAQQKFRSGSSGVVELGTGHSLGQQRGVALKLSIQSARSHPHILVVWYGHDPLSLDPLKLNP
jgi:hypothetical protein